MKTLKTLRYSRLVQAIALALLTLTCGAASAQVLTADGVTLAATSVTPTLGYELFDTTNAQVNVIALPAFVSSVTMASGGAFYYPGKQTSLTVDGTAYLPGEIIAQESFTQVGPVKVPNEMPLATITLGSGTPSSFELGLFTDLYGHDDTQFSITLNDPAGNSTVLEGDTLDKADGGRLENDFYYTLVSGASAGDTITISGATTGVYTMVGGVTFDSAVSIPEPSTWALFLAGLGFMVAKISRRRFQQI